MNTDEIDCVLRRALVALPVHFAGVFAADTVPSIRKYPTCFVVNTDPAANAGEHWVACYVTSPTGCEFFDSYGMPASAYLHIRLPLKVTKHNTASLQGIASNACGHFCIYYLCKRAHGFSLASIVRQLPYPNAVRCDSAVRRFVYNLTSSLRISRPCRGACVGLQCCAKRVK